MSSVICWRCGKKPGLWSQFNDRVWCDACIDIALSVFAVLISFNVPLFAHVKEAADEDVARRVVESCTRPNTCACARCR